MNQINHWNSCGKVYSNPVRSLRFGDKVAVIKNDSSIETIGNVQEFLYEEMSGEYYVSILVSPGVEIKRRISEIAKEI